MSSRRSRTKIPPPRTLHDQFASPRHSGRWGAPDSRRRRLCRGEHACELPAARAEGAASVSVHRRPTPNRCQDRRANVRSEPTTERPARRCAELTYPGGTAFCTLHPRWEPRSLPAESCNRDIRNLSTSSKAVGSRGRCRQHWLQKPVHALLLAGGQCVRARAARAAWRGVAWRRGGVAGSEPLKPLWA